MGNDKEPKWLKIFILFFLGIWLLAGLLLYPSANLARETTATHFGLLETWVDFRAAQKLGIQWDRGHLHWDMVQRSAGGDFYWREFDHYVKEVQQHGFKSLIIIMPFAHWDQTTCHKNQKALGPPCNMDLYKNFVKKTVERYDGDGNQDMPGLRYPIYHWEAFNEPSMKDLPPFYDFTPQDYFNFLKSTHGAIKSACSQCKVVQAGVAGIAPDKKRYLREYLALGAAEYFDIANIHFIHSGDFETFNVGPFKNILQGYDIDKPIWVTEVELESGHEGLMPHLSEEEAASMLVKGYTRAFSLGADNIFYVVLKTAPEFPPSVNRASLIDSQGRKRATYFAMRTMIEKLKGFTDIEKVAENQFKFETPTGYVYVVWNCNILFENIYGKRVLVTNITGREEVKRTGDIKAGDEPVFVRPVEK